jgi:hypothetical protein
MSIEIAIIVSMAVLNIVLFITVLMLNKELKPTRKALLELARRV